MKKINYQSLFKNIIIYFMVFLTGFIGSIILINKQTTDLLNLLVNGDIVGKKELSIFGLKAIEFVSVKHGEAYDINIMKTDIYNYIPFIIGLILVIIALLLTFIIKKIINNKQNR